MSDEEVNQRFDEIAAAESMPDPDALRGHTFLTGPCGGCGIETGQGFPNPWFWWCPICEAKAVAFQGTASDEDLA